MPYRKQKFANEEIYHIVIRAIDDNVIFKNIDDYYRGIFSIYKFNKKALQSKNDEENGLKLKSAETGFLQISYCYGKQQKAFNYY